MYPEMLDPHTKSAAERLLYEAFSTQLEDGYVVFHQVAWIALFEGRRPRDGEADFVIAHPDRGILVLEVKGGAIRRDPTRNEWTSTNASGTHPIKNPVEQAKTGKYILLTQLKAMLPRALPIGHAVAFPDVIVDAPLLGIDLPREIVLDATDLPHLDQWVARTMTLTCGRPTGHTLPLGEDGMAALRTLLGRQWELRPALWGQFLQEQVHLLRLTQEQFRLLDLLNRHHRALIHGFAGSGKTMLAVEKATRLAAQGFQVLLTCFNRNLALDLRSRLQEKPALLANLTISNFHDLCRKMMKRAHIELPPMRDQQTTKALFEEQMPNFLLQASEQLGLRYDAIIVDEGQDFLESWWLALHYLLHDPEQGIFYIFYDEHQRLYQRTSQFPFLDPPYLLTVNCRTTRRIHQHLLTWYHGEIVPVAEGPEGRPVQVRWYERRDQLQETLSVLIDQLVFDEQVPPEEIVVLTPYSERMSRLRAKLTPQGIRLEWFSAPDLVRIETIHAFKGLERSVIILVEVERWLTQGVKAIALDHLLYVGCSRACNHLFVLLPTKTPTELQEHFLSPP